MWFLYSIIALFCWSGSDLFSKIGTKQDDKNSHWKIMFAVGIVMGIHFIITLIGGAIIKDPESVPKFVASLFYTDFKLNDFLIYSPIAFVYILAMFIGYIGLRYIELSISSPICNSSGSLALVLCFIISKIWFKDSPIEFNVPDLIGVILVAVGIISLGFVESREDDELRIKRQEYSNRKYSKSFWAILIPVIYLIIDALGAVGDYLLGQLNSGEEELISEYASNSAFELTFLILAIVSFLWLFFKKKDAKSLLHNKAIYIGATFETIGQAFYMAVMFMVGAGVEGAAAGMVIISAYCALSVLWSRIFLKEKLSYKHYIAIAITFIGIVLLGIFSDN